MSLLSGPTPALPGKRVRVAILASIVLLTLGAGLTLRRITFDFNPQTIYASDSDAFRFMQEHDRLFGRDDNVVVLLVDGQPADRPEVLAYLRQAAELLGKVPGVVRVDGLPTQTLITEQDGALAAVPILPPGPPTEVASERVRAAAIDPLLGGITVARDLSASALFANLSPELYDLKQLEPVVEAIETGIAALPRPPGVQARVAGIPFVRVDAVRDLVGDQLLFLPLTALTYIILLLLLMRWAAGVVLPILAVTVSITWALAALVLANQPINIINNVLPVLLLVLGVSDSIHILTRYRDDLALGRTHDEAAAASFYGLLLACFLSELTTAIGVGSLVTSATPVLREFAIMGAIGVMLDYVAIMLVLPLMISLLPPPRVKPRQPGAGDRIDRALAALVMFIVRRPWTVIGASTAIFAVCGVLVRDLKVDTYLMAVYDESHPNQQTNRLVEKSFGGVIPMDVVLISKSGEDLSQDVDLMRRSSEFQRFLEGQPGIGRTVSVVDLLAAIHRSVAPEQARRDDPRAIPLDDTTVAQLYLVAEMSGEALTSQFKRFVAEDGKRVRIMSRVSDLGARNINALVARADAEVAKIFYGRDDLTIRFTGDGVVGSASIDRFIGDLFISVLSTGLLCFLVIAILFRSPLFGIASVLPSALPMLGTLTVMAVAGINLDVSSITVFALALGLSVNNGIHLSSRYREERQHGSGCKAALVRAYRVSGRAVFFSTGLMLVGFWVLMLSSFLPTRRFGMLSSVCILGAMIGVLFLLPALLVLFDKARRPQPGASVDEPPKS